MWIQHPEPTGSGEQRPSQICNIKRDIPPSGGATREDKRTVLDVQLDIPLGDTFFSEVSYKYGNYASNQSNADYDEHVAAIKFGVKY